MLCSCCAEADADDARPLPRSCGLPRAPPPPPLPLPPGGGPLSTLRLRMADGTALQLAAMNALGGGDALAAAVDAWRAQAGNGGAVVDAELVSDAPPADA